MTITTDALAHLAREVMGWSHKTNNYIDSGGVWVFGSWRTDDFPGVAAWEPHERIDHAYMLLEEWGEKGRDWEIVCCDGSYTVTLYYGCKLDPCMAWTVHGPDRAETTCRAFLAATGWEGEEKS